jgi:hypothetical protein
VLATKDGRIVLENTLDARLEVVFKQQLPEVRQDSALNDLVSSMKSPTYWVLSLSVDVL